MRNQLQCLFSAGRIFGNGEDDLGFDVQSGFFDGFG
jgi:hypothetical protein